MLGSGSSPRIPCLGRGSSLGGRFFGDIFIDLVHQAMEVTGQNMEAAVGSVLALAENKGQGQDKDTLFNLGHSVDRMNGLTVRSIIEILHRVDQIVSILELGREGLLSEHELRGTFQIKAKDVLKAQGHLLVGRTGNLVTGNPSILDSLDAINRFIIQGLEENGMREGQQCLVTGIGVHYHPSRHFHHCHCQPLRLERKESQDVFETGEAGGFLLRPRPRHQGLVSCYDLNEA